MARSVILEWQGQEYEHNPKSGDWYWALGIVAVAAVTAAVLLGNYLLGLVVIAAAATIALHCAKHPPVHQFRLMEHGLVIGEEHYPFEQMLSFSVLEDIEGELPPLLSIKNESWLSPHIVVPLEGVDVDLVYAYFLEHVSEDKHHHSFSDVVAAWLGF